MRKLLLFFAACLVLPALVLPAKGDEILIEGSDSPNHQYVVYAVDDTVNEPAEAHLELRDKSTNKEVFDLGCSGWVVGAQGLAIPGNVAILWNADSTFFALKMRDTKTSTGVTIYKISNQKISHIPQPSLFDAIKYKMGLKEIGRDYFESPKTWISNRSLVINVSGTTIDSSGISEGDPEWYSYDVTVNTSGKITDVKEIKKGYVPSTRNQ